MSGCQCRTARIRSYIDETVVSCSRGTTFRTHELATALCSKYHHGESAHDVARSMRERSDVRLVSPGVWEKL